MSAAATQALSFASSMYVYVLLALTFMTVVGIFAAGLTPHVISTGSMQPAIKPGDIILTNDAVDRAALGAGTVITYEHPNEPGFLVTHRIAALNEDGTYATKGDANRVDDPYVVAPDNIVGAGQLVVPLIGLPATWLRHGMVFEFGLFLLASVVAFAGATLRLGDEEDQAVQPRPQATRTPRSVAAWVQQQVAAVAALGTVVLSAGVVALDRRTGGLLTERILGAMGSGAAPVGTWRLVALAAVALTGFVAVKVALPGGQWEAARGRHGVPQGVVSRLAWFERNGSIFVAVLAMFVLTGAGTALAQTATGACADAASGGSDQLGADIIGSPSAPSAQGACNGTDAEVAVGWTASSDEEATGYEVLRSTTSGGSYSSVGTVSDPAATSFTDSGLSYSTTYYYVIRTITSTSWVSPWTSEVSATTADCSPPDMWISSLPGSSSTKDASNWTATATAEVSDATGIVSGATVSGDWSDLTGTLLGTSSCTTDGSGTCSVSIDPLVTTTDVTFTVTDVSESGHEYGSSKNTTSSVRALALVVALLLIAAVTCTRPSGVPTSSGSAGLYDHLAYLNVSRDWENEGSADNAGSFGGLGTGWLLDDFGWEVVEQRWADAATGTLETVLSSETEDLTVTITDVVHPTEDLSAGPGGDATPVCGSSPERDSDPP